MAVIWKSDVPLFFPLRVWYTGGENEVWRSL